MKLSRALGVALIALAGSAAAQTYPARPVKVIVPYPPGDAADILARLIGPKVSERLGQQMVVENRPGASGQIGMEVLKNSAADGYTIGVGQGGNLVVAPHTYKKIPYDPLKDFVPSRRSRRITSRSSRTPACRSRPPPRWSRGRKRIRAS